MVRSIPPGKVSSYGEIGRMLRNPVSGYLVGRWMAMCPADVPWWRVVTKSGALAIWKKYPPDANKQRMLLESEGVVFTNDCVDMQKFSWS